MQKHKVIEGAEEYCRQTVMERMKDRENTRNVCKTLRLPLQLLSDQLTLEPYDH